LPAVKRSDEATVLKSALEADSISVASAFMHASVSAIASAEFIPVGSAGQPAQRAPFRSADL
jgi:hypothetical protein